MSTLVVSSADYHGEVGLADQPCLSKSIIHMLLQSSPAHARAAHPKLNPTFVRQEEDKFDVGTAAHQLVLEGDAGVWVIAENDYRTKVAKEARDHARALGKIPLLAKHWDAVQEMAEAIWEQIPELEVYPQMFTAGKPEQTLVWEESGVTCKARLDWLRDDHATIDDLKTTGSAAPEAWGKRTCFSIGGDLQAAFYLRGAKACLERTPKFRFLVVETKAPFAMTPFFVGERELTIANAKIDFALATWRECLENDEWPAYPRQLVPVQAPAWSENDWFDREARDAA